MGAPAIHPGSRCLAALVSATFLVVAAAAGAPAGAQEGREGEIIILRDVPPRIAYREAVPAPPVTVKTAREVDLSATGIIVPTVVTAAPGATLISDLEAGAIAANTEIRSGVASLGSSLGGRIAGALSGGFGAAGRAAPGAGAAAQLNPVSPLSQPRLSAVGGSVQQATAGLGRTIVNAVAPR